MRYFSTRSGSDSFLTFEQAVLAGLAPDGGLFIPEKIPQISLETLESWSSLSFPQLAHHIFRLYIDTTEISDEKLTRILETSFSTFTDPNVVAPLVDLPVKSNYSILELFHGPTFAFKDVALQVLGNLFEFFLARKNKKWFKSKRAKLTIGK